MPNNYVLLDRIELNNTAASVTFDNIPQSGYTDLKIVVSARGDTSASSVDLRLRFNNNTSSTYTHRRIQGNGATAVSSSETNGTSVYCGEISAATGTGSTFSNTELYIPNYLSTTAKSFSADAVQENNTTTAYASLFASIWNPSPQAAINAVNLILGAGNFVAGSTFSLYGIAQVGTTPVVAPKADGGNVIETDGTYWYHTFLTNGTFTPQVGLTCDYLVIAGGGGGGASDLATTNWGGGGGAGGYRTSVGTSGGGGSSESPLSLTTTNYAITVGAGGSGLASGFTNGVNSTFSTITSTGGGYGSGLNLVPNWYAAAVGGSGGGGSEGSNPGAAGTANQGYAGGTVTVNNACGGGGGAGGAGASPTSGTTGGAGGAGITSSISGTSVARAGGGGGAGTSPGTATAGGGAASSSTTGSNGTVNTGGGGGAGTRNGGNGGSGVVIIRYPVA